jgi:hypothetical protein
MISRLSLQMAFCPGQIGMLESNVRVAAGA